MTGCILRLTVSPGNSRVYGCGCVSGNEADRDARQYIRSCHLTAKDPRLKSALYLTNPELAEMVREHENPAERAKVIGALIRSWADMQDGGEQRETIDRLVKGMNQERLSVRKLFPEEFKGRSW